VNLSDPTEISKYWKGRVRPKSLFLLLFLVIVLAVIVDRSLWASVSPWREDTATNIWLGYTQNPLNIPVGLISEQYLPNPNGLVLFSELLSRLPNLWVIGTVLGVGQAVLIGWVCWLITDDLKILLIVSGPLLSSVILREVSVDPWNQWMLLPLNLLFLGGVLIYLRRSTLWVLPLFVSLIVISPSIYLAGVVNSIAYVLVIIIVAFLNPPKFASRNWVAPTIVSAVIVALSIWLTWYPYFREVGLVEVLGAGNVYGLSLNERIVAAFKSFATFPVWSISQWVIDSNSADYPVLLFGNHVLSEQKISGYRLLRGLTLFQGILSYLIILLALVVSKLKRRSLAQFFTPGRNSSGLAAFLMILLVALSYAISPLIGGPVWANNQRLDNVTQFLPLLLLSWFLMPFLVELPGLAKKWVLRITWIISITYTVTSLIVGVLIVMANLSYRGNVLTQADVPLVDKLQAIGFIANDWKSNSSSKIIPVDYDLGGGFWDWIPKFGTRYSKWYAAPFTLGRAFDYEFLREYGLHNYQEGIEIRSFGTGRYLINYAFDPPPQVPGHPMRDYVFGRLRVSIVDK
jgi:hypothetical protein